MVFPKVRTYILGGAFLIALGDGTLLVVGMFAAAEGDLDFDERVLEINFERHERIARFIDFARDLGDLDAVQKKLSILPAVARREGAAFIVEGDVHVFEEHFAALDEAETFRKRGFAEAQRFDFRAFEHDARFELFFDEVFKGS